MDDESRKIILARRARMIAAGSCLRGDQKLVAALRARIAAAGLARDVEFRPNLDKDAKREFLRELTLLSVPTTYGESFGLYLLEAWAAGVPVVQPDHAAFPELLAASGGGILVKRLDASALAAALLQLNPALVVACQALLWFGAEMLLAYWARWPLSSTTLLGMLIRDCMMLPLWVTALFSSRFEWGGHQMQASARLSDVISVTMPPRPISSPRSSWIGNLTVEK